jgi:hypothetical protein
LEISGNAVWNRSENAFKDQLIFFPAILCVDQEESMSGAEF